MPTCLRGAMFFLDTVYIELQEKSLRWSFTVGECAVATWASIPYRHDAMCAAAANYIIKLQNCPRLKIEVPPTAFRTETLTLTLTLTSDFDLQSNGSYDHDPYTSKRSRSKVTLIKSYSGNRRTGGQTNGGDCIPGNGKY